MWREWVEEGKDIWAIARVARNPFGLKEKGNSIMVQGALLETDKEFTEAFVRHNLKTEDVPRRARTPERLRRPSRQSHASASKKGPKEH